MRKLCFLLLQSFFAIMIVKIPIFVTSVVPGTRLVEVKAKLSIKACGNRGEQTFYFEPNFSFMACQCECNNIGIHTIIPAVAAAVWKWIKVRGQLTDKLLWQTIDSPLLWKWQEPGRIISTNRGNCYYYYQSLYIQILFPACSNSPYVYHCPKKIRNDPYSTYFARTQLQKYTLIFLSRESKMGINLIPSASHQLVQNIYKILSKHNRLENFRIKFQ